MAPTAGSSKTSSMAKGKGVSSVTAFDLRAEIAKHQEEFAKNKVVGKNKAVVGGVRRPDKKPTVWAKQNKGVKDRATRDVELEAVSKPTLERARAILEQKAAMYDKLMKGQNGGLSDKQYGALLVNFDEKPSEEWESDEDDVDESLTVPKPPPDDEKDPVIEYQDEFGRQRTARRSEIPRHLLPRDPNEEPPEEDIDPFVIYNPVNHFPTYEPTEDRTKAIIAEFSEENNPLNVHYDASQEVRAKGAAFYQFSGDEETRKKQMEELKKAREETEKTRQETGAVDLLPGEVEVAEAGAGAGGSGGTSEGVGLKNSRAVEKRKRELQERRMLLEAKRRKKDPSGPAPKPTLDKTSSMPPPSDPFTRLESQTAPAAKNKAKGLPSALNTADDFLAALERDMLKGAR